MPCPNLEFCVAKVKIEHFKQYCQSDDDWKNCKFYVEVEMIPSHWKKYIRDESSSSSRLF